jgi:CubicO group peptidase (beta-lactamase class C family)
MRSWYFPPPPDMKLGASSCPTAPAIITRRDLIGGIGALALAGGVPLRLAGAQPAATIAPAERAAMADVALAFLKDQGVPGLAVAIADCGQVVYEAGFGFADKARAEKVIPTNLFRIASVSKVLTSVAVFTLVEKGHLTLADKVFGTGGVLGTDYGTAPYKPFVEDISIEHLLTHTSGWQKDVPDPMFSHPGMNQAQLISWTIDNTPPTTPQGRDICPVQFRLLRARARDREGHQAEV